MSPRTNVSDVFNDALHNTNDSNISPRKKDCDLNNVDIFLMIHYIIHK